MEQKESDRKTIYDTGSGEIFLKNFLAGFGHALGNIVVYIILIVILYNLFMTKVFPRIAPFLNTLTSLSESLEKMPNISGGSGIVIPDSIKLPDILRN